MYLKEREFWGNKEEFAKVMVLVLCGRGDSRAEADWIVSRSASDSRLENVTGYIQTISSRKAAIFR